MKRLAQLGFLIAVIGQARAADLALVISPPQPPWLLPPTSLPQLQPEGVPAPGEERLFGDVLSLLLLGDYERVLARIEIDYGAELALLEAGDSQGFLRTRQPTAGNPQLGLPRAQERPQQGDSDADFGMAPRDNRPSAFDRSVLAQRRGLDGSPNLISANMLYLIGHTYFALERYVPAATAFELALTALPDHVRAHESLGFLYLRTERYGDAREHLSRATQLGRNTADVHAALGYAEHKARQYWAAANAFQRALAFDPGHSGAQRGLLLTLIETREHAKAKALVEQSLRSVPDDRDLWLYRAQIALAVDEPAVALASLETALRLGDDSVANREALVALQIESGNFARAVDLLRGSSARGLDFALVDQALGWLANENAWDDFRALLASVDRTALGGAEQSRLLARRASLALRDGNRRAATTALQEALALDPANAGALMALGQIYRGDRDYGRADLLFRRAGAYDAENALVARADLAIAQEDFDGALTILRNVVTSNPARSDLERNIDSLEDIVLLRTQR